MCHSKRECDLGWLWSRLRRSRLLPGVCVGKHQTGRSSHSDAEWNQKRQKETMNLTNLYCHMSGCGDGAAYNYLTSITHRTKTDTTTPTQTQFPLLFSHSLSLSLSPPLPPTNTHTHARCDFCGLIVVFCPTSLSWYSAPPAGAALRDVSALRVSLTSDKHTTTSDVGDRVLFGCTTPT